MSFHRPRPGFFSPGSVADRPSRGSHSCPDASTDRSRDPPGWMASTDLSRDSATGDGASTDRSRDCGRDERRPWIAAATPAQAVSLGTVAALCPAEERGRPRTARGIEAFSGCSTRTSGSCWRRLRFMLNGKRLLLQLAEVRRVWRTHSVTLGTSAAAASCLRPTGRDRRGRVPSEDEHEAVSQTCLLRPRTGGSARGRACAEGVAIAVAPKPGIWPHVLAPS